MEVLLTTILAWPVILQGALGSALFWMVLKIGQKITSIGSRLLAQRSRRNELKYLSDLRDKYLGVKHHYAKRPLNANYIVTGFIYKSLRSLYAGLIWLALGLMFSSFIPVLGVVGFIGCIYYLFKGLSVIQEVDKTVDIDEKIKEIDVKIALLKAK